MSHENLKFIRDNLVRSIESQVCNIYEADSEELGCAIDMLKDLEEALYYCTITEAMTDNGNGHHNGNGKHNGNEYEFEYHHNDRSYMEYPYDYPIMYNMPRMYDGGSIASGSSLGGSRGGELNGYIGRDHREGRSPEMRRMYMEAKEMKHDKAIQMRELEKYMQELSQDITDMIGDATVEEKQYLEKKLVTLASKINQMK